MRALGWEHPCRVCTSSTPGPSSHTRGDVAGRGESPEAEPERARKRWESLCCFRNHRKWKQWDCGTMAPKSGLTIGPHWPPQPWRRRPAGSLWMSYRGAFFFSRMCVVGPISITIHHGPQRNSLLRRVEPPGRLKKPWRRRFLLDLWSDWRAQVIISTWALGLPASHQPKRHTPPGRNISESRQTHPSIPFPSLDSRHPTATTLRASALEDSRRRPPRTRPRPSSHLRGH